MKKDFSNLISFYFVGGFIQFMLVQVCTDIFWMRIMSGAVLFVLTFIAVLLTENETRGLPLTSKQIKPGVIFRLQKVIMNTKKVGNTTTESFVYLVTDNVGTYEYANSENLPDGRYIKDIKNGKIIPIDETQ